MFIFNLINILADRQKTKREKKGEGARLEGALKKKKKQTSDKYTRFQKTILLFQVSHKITISKVVLYISRSLHLRRSRSVNTQSRRKPQEIEREKEEEREKR